MRLSFAGAACLWLVGLLACSDQAATAAPQTADIDRPADIQNNDRDVLYQYLDLNARIETIAYKILRANARQCPQTEPGVGLHVQTIRDFPQDMQSLAAQELGVGDMPHVRHVVDGSSAAKSGFRRGDAILAIGDYDMIAGRSARQFFESVSRLEFTKGETRIKIDRGGEILMLNVRPETLCGYPVQLFYADFVNAYTDGEDIWVTTELLGQIESDISLALIVAHELAHATEGHIFQKPGKDLELTADRLGIKYLVRAGYDGQTAIAEWIANPYNHKPNAQVTHPSADERIAAMQAALSDLE